MREVTFRRRLQLGVGKRPAWRLRLLLRLFAGAELLVVGDRVLGGADGMDESRRRGRRQRRPQRRRARLRLRRVVVDHVVEELAERVVALDFAPAQLNAHNLVAILVKPD
jgi:hypothetical protein